MLMIKGFLTLAVGGFVAAQSTSTNASANALIFSPESVPMTTRAQWCNAQQNNCPKLCGGQYNGNDCSATVLTYNCTCQNGSAPANINSYRDTLPYFICQQNTAQCIIDHPNDARGQAQCRQTYVCGTLDPQNAPRAAVSSSSSSSTSSLTRPTSTATQTVNTTNSAPASTTSAPSPNNANVLNVGGHYGASLFAGFVAILFWVAL